jgi:hypothetical protein
MKESILNIFFNKKPKGSFFKKQIIILPENFQEIVILKEMKFNNGDRDLELIRELLYLYSVKLF